MRVLYHDPRCLDPSDEDALGLTWVPFERLLAESDFVSLHARLTPETRHMMGEPQFARMKPTAFFVNTARGPLVDEAALVRRWSESASPVPGWTYSSTSRGLTPRCSKCRTSS